MTIRFRTAIHEGCKPNMASELDRHFSGSPYCDVTSQNCLDRSGQGVTSSIEQDRICGGLLRLYET
jgi:hypothetical protein